MLVNVKNVKTVQSTATALKNILHIVKFGWEIV